MKIGGKVTLLVLAALLTGAELLAAAWLGWPLLGSAAVLLLGAILFVALAAGISADVRNGAARLTEAVTAMNKGEFAFTPAAEGDMADAEYALAALAKTLAAYTAEMTTLGAKHNGGDMAATADERAYTGAFNEGAKALNAAFKEYARVLNDMTDIFQSAKRGDLNAPLRGLSGGKAAVGTALEAAQANTRVFLSELQKWMANLSEGRLTQRIDTAALSGEWAKELALANQLQDTIAAALSEATDRANRLAKDDYTRVSARNSRGDYAALFQALDTAAAHFSEQQREITSALTELAQYTPRGGSYRGYSGPISALRDATGAIANKMDKLAGDEIKHPPARPAAPLPRPAAVNKPGAIPPAATRLAAVPSNTTFVSAQSNMATHAAVAAPSSSKVYDAKDFGKY